MNMLRYKWFIHIKKYSSDQKIKFSKPAEKAKRATIGACDHIHNQSFNILQKKSLWNIDILTNNICQVY